jgi:hypothetical protein
LLRSNQRKPWPALSGPPALTRADLDALRASLTDRFAADMLSQAMAESATR